MATPGARSDLVKELRRIGPKCWDAAECLGLTVHLVTMLPPGTAFALNAEDGFLVGESGNEWSVWAACAQYLADEMGLDVDLDTILSAATAMTRRSSGVFAALRTA